MEFFERVYSQNHGRDVLDRQILPPGFALTHFDRRGRVLFVEVPKENFATLNWARGTRTGPNSVHWTEEGTLDPQNPQRLSWTDETTGIEIDYGSRRSSPLQL